jgi:hypothetical protein
MIGVLSLTPGAHQESTYILRGRPRGVSSQAPELGERKIGITPFDCPVITERDEST